MTKDFTNRQGGGGQIIAYETAAILQNIASQKTITLMDCANAMRLAYLSVFPGNTMAGTAASPVKFPLGYFPHVTIMSVVGTGNGKAKGRWVSMIWGGGGEDGLEMNNNALIRECSVLNYTKDSVAASEFYPTLKITENEVKLLIQCSLFYDMGAHVQGSFLDGTLCKDVPPRRAFNFLMLNPAATGSTGCGFFTSVVILSPASGFPETPPQ